jgi:hypothetical protein
VIICPPDRVPLAGVRPHGKIQTGLTTAIVATAIEFER